MFVVLINEASIDLIKKLSLKTVKYCVFLYYLTPLCYYISQLIVKLNYKNKK